MGQLVDAQKEVTITSEATERELELEAQLVEARSIIQEQVFTKIVILDFLNYYDHPETFTQISHFFFFFFLQCRNL